MKKKLILIPLLLLCAFAWAQPSGYVPGTQVCWTFNGKPHGYFKAAGNGERHILIFFTGYGEVDCNNYDFHSPSKLFKDAGINWNGRSVRAPGDTIVWEVLTIPRYDDFWIPAYANNINYFFQHIAPIDTSDHSRFHIMGLSQGVGRMWGFLVNWNSHNSPYRHIFSTTISLSGQEQVQMASLITEAARNRRHWVWYGTAETGQTAPYASEQIWGLLQHGLIRHKTPQTGTGHGADTWDSCMSIKGGDTTTNRWLWMARKPDTITPGPQPEPCPRTGGPAGYVAGTQVNWRYNNRDHGYFRARGCGERHVLVVFNGDNSTDSTNYQANAPQTLFKDAGANWDGRTVRAPGDTVVWEVLTINQTSNYYLADYTNDIAYFLQNISPIDTSEHRYFHIAGIGHGNGRMWGYLTDQQTNNSPYRHIFSTTLTVSTTWTGIATAVSAYSTGRSHWVWHGTAEGGTTPLSAGEGFYNILNGYKQITKVTGGTHGASTWDSCFSITGTDSTSNRWIWMAQSAGGVPSFARMAALKTEVAASPETGSNVYPNPARNTAQVTWKAAAGVSYRLTLTDMNGQVQRNVSGLRNGRYTLDVSGLSKGLYIVRIDSGGEQRVLKLVKE